MTAVFSSIQHKASHSAAAHHHARLGRCCRPDDQVFFLVAVGQAYGAHQRPSRIRGAECLFCAVLVGIGIAQICALDHEPHEPRGRLKAVPDTCGRKEDDALFAQ